MATPKQLAALAKARAARAKKKKPITAKSQITGKPPSKRLKKRRAANTKKGYFPNPVRRSKKYIVRVVTQAGKIGYLTSDGVADTDITLAYGVQLKFAEKRATDFFNKHKSKLRSVEVIEKK